MIRPVTLISWILALSAGLYLYRAKHDVELMDQHIEQIAKQTADLRTESRGLLDEWIRLGEPEQLHRYSDEYLGLQPISPPQFARMGDLSARLPAPQPLPAEPPANVVAQSSEATSIAASTAETQSSGDPNGAARVDPADATTTGAEWENAAGADDIPVPPIPPSKAPVFATTAPTVTALPLQARPVTPRPTDSQLEPETARSRTGAVPPTADESHVGMARVTPSVPIEPPQGAPGPINDQAPGPPAHGLPSLQTQAPRDIPGLPPLQAQGPTRETALAPSRAPVLGQPLGQPLVRTGPSAPRLSEPRTAESRPSEPSRETRPIEPQPIQRQAAEPRNPGTQIGRQAPAPMEQAQMAPAQGGSLLGMSRSSVPLPLPAPTPVNANWSGPAGTGSLGSGR